MNVEHNAQSAFRPKAGFFATLLVLALFGSATLVPSVASARQVRLFAGAFGAATSTPANPYPLASGFYGPSSVAVESQSGDVYVTDQGNRRVEKFDSAGNFLLMFGKDVNRTAVEAAAPEAQRNLCTAASGDVCKAGVQAGTPGAFDPANASSDERAYLFVAVDNSAGASHGDVYVADSSDHLITKFTSAGAVVGSWGDNGPLNTPNGQLSGANAAGPVSGPFAILFEGIAVDAAGNLWVAQQDGSHSGDVFEFAQDSSFIRDWFPDPEGGGGGYSGQYRAGIALDSKDDVYLMPWKFDFAGHTIGRVSEVGSFGIAVDPGSDELYVAAQISVLEPVLIQRYDASCHPIKGFPCTPVESFGAGHFSAKTFTEGAHGLAIDPSTAADTVYASELRGEVARFAIETVPDVEARPASGFTAGSAILNATVNPAGLPLTECFFEWGEGTEPYAHKVPCESPDAAGVGAGKSPVAVHAQISGLSAGHAYHFRVVAANANTDLAKEPSQGQDLSFGPPLLEGTYATGVSASAATLGAEVNPGGVDTHLRFEYGTQAGVYEHALPAIDLGSGAVAQSFTEGLQGLQSLTVYHYRAVVENLFGTIEGEDRSFTTQGAGASTGQFALPDGRGWELVSPPDKNGIPLEAISDQGGVIQAAADGSGLAYIAKGTIGSEAVGNRSFAESQLLAHRGATGWSTQDVTTPHQAPAGLRGNLSEYLLFSSDLSLGAVEPEGTTPLSSAASERTPYLRNDTTGEYTPLVDPGNVPEGVKFGGKEFRPELFTGGVEFATATPDLSHVIFNSSQALTSPSFPTGGQPSVYESTAGSLSLVSQIPAGPAIVCGGGGPACAPVAAKGLGSLVGNQGFQMRHAVSADGSRVFFGAAGGLYLRDLARGETLKLDAAEAGCGSCESGGGRFQDASADGSRVLFTDAQRLTTDAGKAGSDLYECRIEETAGHLSCALTDLTVDHNPGESAAFEGALIGSAEDGTSLYFVANGALAPGAVHGNCQSEKSSPAAATATCNLYRYDVATAATTLIAVLSNRDGNDWNSELGIVLGALTARVSPDGRWLAFMSQRPLTGYDNRDAKSGQPDEEVFLYHALAGPGEEGKLICASCNPTGARPVGFLESPRPPFPLVDRPNDQAGQWIAASIPGWTRIRPLIALYQSRYLSNSGRLFFNANDALVPQDSNGSEDVYQYEPPGVGGCTQSGPTFGQKSGGCVDLISSGASGEESAFLDASESGNDVFFLTQSQLSPRDHDQALDVYDARVGGGEPEIVKPVECSGDACQGFVQAPNDPTPGSLIFSGPGNLVGGLASNPTPPVKKTVKCARGKKLSHNKCVKQKSRKRRAKKAKRVTNDRRVKR